MPESWPLTTLSDYGLVKSPEFKNIIHPCGINPTTGARVEQRLNKQSHETPTWKIVLKNRRTSEAATLYTFFCARRGDYESFNITDPTDSTVYLVRFTEGMMDFEYFSVLLFNSQLKVTLVNS